MLTIKCIDVLVISNATSDALHVDCAIEKNTSLKKVNILEITCNLETRFKFIVIKIVQFFRSTRDYTDETNAPHRERKNILYCPLRPMVTFITLHRQDV